MRSLLSDYVLILPGVGKKDKVTSSAKIGMLSWSLESGFSLNLDFISKFAYFLQMLCSLREVTKNLQVIPNILVQKEADTLCKFHCIFNPHLQWVLCRPVRGRVCRLSLS